MEQYFPILTHRVIAKEALRLTQTEEVYDVEATLDGGGTAGQAGAVRLGIARALVALDPETRPTLKKAGLLTRDAREKERRKYGLKKARKAPQYSKRQRAAPGSASRAPLRNRRHPRRRGRRSHLRPRRRARARGR